MKKILIIDDDATFRKTLSDSLSPDKYIVSTAVNAKDGLEKIKNDKPDLIILDISMPEMGGIELLQNLKEESINVPILIASQLSQIEVVSESIETGVNIGVKGYILKASESLDMIIQTIEKTLAQ